MSAGIVAVAEFIPSPMGGGWIVPLSDEAGEICEDVFGEAPASLPPIGGTHGYIIEPADMVDTVEALRNGGCEVTL